MKVKRHLKRNSILGIMALAALMLAASCTNPTNGDGGAENGDGGADFAKILASDGAVSDEFGQSVAISGDYAIVGALGDDDNGSGSGSAYVFRSTGTNTWDSGTKIVASDGAENDYFGYSVAISGDYAIVGAYLDDDNGSGSGSAYIRYVAP